VTTINQQILGEGNRDIALKDVSQLDTSLNGGDDDTERVKAEQMKMGFL